MAQDIKIVADIAAAQPLPGDGEPAPGAPSDLPPPVAATVAAPANPASSPPPLPGAPRRGRAAEASANPAQPDGTAPGADEEARPQRRVSRRRPAGPVRGRIAANDDAPSIGGLIYALEQKPSNKPFFYAGIATALWLAVGLGFAWVIVSTQIEAGATLAQIAGQPTTFFTAAAIVVPVAILWFLALLAWRSEELRLRSSTMTEVAVRLAEPDRMAEQSVASLGQAVRRQVSFMNDAVSRALGRAGELEALVHNEVSALERSYEDNERKIRGLIQELTGERHALLNTSERVSDTLKHLGTEVPTLIDKLSQQQIKLAQIIQGAGENLTQLESAVGQSAERLETTLGARTEALQGVLGGYTEALGSAIGTRTDEMQFMLESYTTALADALSNRADNLQTVFEEYARALDTTLTNRAQALDIQLVERTKSLDAAFNERLRLFDDSIMRSTMAIDGAVAEKARALTTALDSHARTFSETITRQSMDLDESLMQGISAVRRTSENITRQSLKAIEGLAGQTDMLRNVSENILTQIHTVTNRFETQGQSIMRAANSLESANYKIEATLQSRHAELSHTLDVMSGKADEFGRFVEGYSSTIEGSLTDAERRARAVTEQLLIGTEERKSAALADLERMKSEAGAETDRAIEDLRRRFSSVTSAVSAELGSLQNRFDATSEEVRQRATKAAADIAAEQARIREELERLPVTARESTDAMRRTLQDQLRALDHLSTLTTRTAQQRDVRPPMPPGSLTSAYSREARVADTGPPGDRGLSTLAGERSTRPPLPALPRPPGPAQGGDSREGWSLGDLLARASLDEDPQGHAGGPAAGSRAPGPFQLNVEVIARALDPATTQALWSRIRAGQRGVMVRSIYSPEGRMAFEEISRRYASDPDLQRTVNRYLTDFERIQNEAEQRDPTGRLLQNHLVSDTGRVYLFLAHASGRLS